MLKLHGFPSSNYYNVAKLALLEKGIEFEEILCFVGAGEEYNPEYLDKSPMGKVPALETPEGYISESRAILEYLESSYPTPPLLPNSSFHRAKTQELSQFIELYFELAARRMVPYVLGGLKPDPAYLTQFDIDMHRAASALSRLSKFEEFAYGDQFSLADVASINHLSFASGFCRHFLSEDRLAKVPGVAAYLDRMQKRPHVQTINSDAKAGEAAFMAHLRTLYGETNVADLTPSQALQGKLKT